MREMGVPFEEDVARGHPENVGFEFKQSQYVALPRTALFYNTITHQT
jgi:hypothetical protein